MTFRLRPHCVDVGTDMSTSPKKALENHTRLTKNIHGLKTNMVVSTVRIVFTVPAG